MNKYEQLIEHIINDENDQARKLFHTIVVEKSRDIYESLIDEQDLEEVGGNKVEDLVDEITVDEQGISEEEEDAVDADEAGEEDHHADVGGDEALEDRVLDLEDALDELKAEFDALMTGEEAEEEQFPGIHGDEVAGDEVADNEEFMEAEECDKEESAEEVDEDAEIVREYVEKVAAPSNTEGADNKTSVVAKKNDMGGTSANIVKGGTENGGTVKKPAVNDAGNINVPGGKAGNAFKK